MCPRSQITDQLWISDITSVREYPTGRFDRIITVCQEDISDNIGCSYDRFNMADGPYNAYGGDSSYGTFKEAANTLYEALQTDETILIHCHAGQSRSVSVSIAALARLRDMSFEEALELISENRPQANPGKHLEKHARTYIEEGKFPNIRGENDPLELIFDQADH